MKNPDVTADRLRRLLDEADISHIADLVRLAKGDGALWVYSRTCSTVFCGYVVDRQIVSWLMASAADGESAKRMAEKMAGALEVGFRGAVAAARAVSKASRH